MSPSNHSSSLIHNIFAIIILAMAMAGYLFPTAFSWVLMGFGSGLLKSNGVSVILGLIMFGMGMTLTKADLWALGKRPWTIALGMLCQFGIMAGLGWLLVKGFRLPEGLAIGVILVACCPGGTASNVITYIARGDVAFSVSMTTASTLVSPILTPMLTLWLAGSRLPVDPTGLFISIVQVVVLPITLGIILRGLFPRVVNAMLHFLPLFSVVGIGLIVAAVVGGSTQSILKAGAIVMGVVVLLNGLGLALGYTVGKIFRLEEAQSRTLSIEVGMQNSGLAVVLAKQHFSTMPEAALPGALFSVWHNISGSLLASFWNWRDSRKRG